MKTTLLLIITTFLISICVLNSYAETDSTKKHTIFLFEIKEEIAPPVLHKTQKAFKEAEKIAADYILIHMNTYGGMVDAADSIRTKILNSKIPVVVFIDNNAASAGALISIACDKIYMRKGANIGAATVVNQSGEVVPDKFQSYMRSMMRSTAEAKGKDPDIAQAMVDPTIYIEGIIDSGKVLTFTTSEAIKFGFCDGEAENIEEVLKHLNIKEYKIVKLELTATDRIIQFLINPMISGLLIMIIIGGIYFELQTPGIGFPIGAAVIAATMYFAPLYIEGLAQNWEIILFILGIILIAVEIFVIPGFGVAGISGIILIVTGLTLSMIGNIGFTFKGIDITEVSVAFFTVITASFLSLLSSFFFTKKVFATTRFGHLALDKSLGNEDGFTSSEKGLKDLIGKEGTTVTILRPAGTIEIDDEHYDAVSQISYIEKGEKIKIINYENSQLIVRKA